MEMPNTERRVVLLLSLVLALIAGAATWVQQQRPAAAARERVAAEEALHALAAQLGGEGGVAASELAALAARHGFELVVVREPAREVIGAVSSGPRARRC